MKWILKIFFMNRIFIFFFLLLLSTQMLGQPYQPTTENLLARKQFQDNRFGPVSYTHLDVYKRQPEHRRS